MINYLGEFPSSFGIEMTKEEWVLTYLVQYKGIHGTHHKDWLLDQIARIMLGTPVTTVSAKWGKSTEDVEHEEIRFRTGMPSQAYLEWVAQYQNGEDGPETYQYYVGIAP